MSNVIVHLNKCFFMWSTRSPSKKLLVPGKRTGHACTGQQASPPISSIADILTATVAVVKCQATIAKGELGGDAVDIMLDSGSSVSLVWCDLLSTMKNVSEARQPKSVQLVTASETNYQNSGT